MTGTRKPSLAPSGRVFRCPICHREEDAPAALLDAAPKGPLCFGPEGTDFEDDLDGHELVPMVELCGDCQRPLDRCENNPNGRCI